MRVEFEWKISDPQWRGQTKIVWVREAMSGTQLSHMFGPMPIEIAESFILARRQMVDRNIKTKYQAINIFENRPQLAAMAEASRSLKDVLEDEVLDDPEMPIPNFPEH